MFLLTVKTWFRGPPGEKGDTPKFEPSEGIPETIVGPYGLPGAIGEKGDKGTHGRDGSPGEPGKIKKTLVLFINKIFF